MDSNLERGAQVLQQLADQIFSGSPTVVEISLEDLHSQFSGPELITVDSYVQKLDSFGLVEFSVAQQVLRKTPKGKAAYHSACIPEIVLGHEFIDQKFSGAVFHVIVEKEDGSEGGGTAFYCADFPRFIATARHVVDGKTILRFENQFGMDAGFEVGVPRFPDDPELDVALIPISKELEMPGFRVAWDSAESSEISGRRAEHVSVFGYPPAPLHSPSLYNFQAQIETRTRQYKQYESLIISRSRPGCSGGPVVDYRGIVVGIISTAPQRVESSAGKTPDLDFVAAIPAMYFGRVPH